MMAKREKCLELIQECKTGRAQMLHNEWIMQDKIAFILGSQLFKMLKCLISPWGQFWKGFCSRTSAYRIKSQIKIFLVASQICMKQNRSLHWFLTVMYAFFHISTNSLAISRYFPIFSFFDYCLLTLESILNLM